METIAVYWEENIKTYGIQVETDLCLARVDIAPRNLVSIGRQLEELCGRKIDFKLILAATCGPEQLDLLLLLDRRWQDTLTKFFSTPGFQDITGQAKVESPVEMLYFHGPHFGDRYGIAHMAVNTLEQKNINYIAAGCSAASVHFILPETMAAQAKKAMESVFQTP